MNGLELWNAVESVDKKYTKKIEGRDFGGDTVNLTYTTKKLTEALGPAGDMWGWEVMDERVYEYGSHEQKNFTAVHSVRVRLWRRREDGSMGHIEDYGTTKIAYYAGRDQGKYLKVDEEFAKKSLSDAKSKLFVALGGSAQVWLGEFDRTQHKYVGRDQGDSDGDRLARASHPVDDATYIDAVPAGRTVTDAGEPTFVLDGVRHTGEDWISAAVLTAKRLQPSAMIVWWDKTNDERAKLHKRRPDLNEKLDKLKAKVLAKAETFNGGPPTIPPLDVTRAG